MEKEVIEEAWARFEATLSYLRLDQTRVEPLRRLFLEYHLIHLKILFHLSLLDRVVSGSL